MHDLVVQAVRPLAENPELRRRLLEIRRAHDIYWDEVNRDKLLEAAAQDPTAASRGGCHFLEGLPGGTPRGDHRHRGRLP